MLRAGLGIWRERRWAHRVPIWCANSTTSKVWSMLSPPSDGNAIRFSPHFPCLFLGKHNHKMIFYFLLSRQPNGVLGFYIFTSLGVVDYWSCVWISLQLFFTIRTQSWNYRSTASSWSWRRLVVSKPKFICSARHSLHTFPFCQKSLSLCLVSEKMQDK